MPADSPDGRLGTPAQVVLIAILLGSPVALLAAVAAFQQRALPPRPVARAAPTPAGRILYGPVFSATHWNHAVISYATGEQGVYALNHATSVDPETETEAERTYHPFPSGTVLVKEHRPVDGHGPSLFTTTMIRTTQPHGPAGDPWRYERADAAGRIVLGGTADDPQIQQQCAECHGNARHRDFVFHNQPPLP